MRYGGRMREDLGKPVTIGRLLITADSLFELDGRRYQEGQSSPPQRPRRR